LEVPDNGVGMDDATIAKIFASFFIAKPSGHWLGLAAILSVIRGHAKDTRIIAIVAQVSHLLPIRKWLSDSPFPIRQHALGCATSYSPKGSLNFLRFRVVLPRSDVAKAGFPFHETGQFVGYRL
jgi:hypothetical protein